MAADLPPAQIPAEKAATPALQPTADYAATSTLAPKRQRRPSVRLGEIGDQPATLRAASKSWKLNPHFNSKPSNKTRPLTNLVTCNSDGTSSYEFDASPLYTVESNGNIIFDSSLFAKEEDYRTAKKTTIAAKRMRNSTNWRADESAAVDEEKERHNGDREQERFRDFDPEAYQNPSQLREQSADNEWNAHCKKSIRVRVSDSHDPEVDGNLPQSDSRDRNRFPDEEVRNWLSELGLGKYSPVFEIHEVDEQVLPFLTLEDLKDMGINAVGSRRKMLCAIQKLRKGFS